jgi:hypothetical protein
VGNNEIKVIETVYSGYRFRSRLEARWAVFFDALGIEYEYEKEGFELPSGWYLPDFWLPEQDIWVEIKPKNSSDTSPKYGELAILTKKNVYLCDTGIINKMPEDWVHYCVQDLIKCEPSMIFSDGCDFPYVWCECPYCGSLDVQFDGRSERNKHKNNCTNPDGHKIYTWYSDNIASAYTKARQSRFEFGKTQETD